MTALKYSQEVYEDGTRKWFNKDGQLHHLRVPAISYANGAERWYKNGLLHRLAGPAVKHATGTLKWCQEGELHREDGYAIEFAAGGGEYWLRGNNYSEVSFKSKMNTCADKIVTIEGKKYKLVEVGE